MKTKNLFSRFSAAALVAAAALIPGVLSSCSSDAEPNIPDEKPIPEGMAQLNFGISYSSLESATRAAQTMDATADQAKIKTLYLYIFKTDADGSNPVFVDRISCAGGTGSSVSVGGNILGDSYHRIYEHAFNPGYYKFFVVANIEDYLTQTSGKTILTQDISDSAPFALTDLTNAELTFTSTSGATAGQGDKLRAKGGVELPMAADCTDVKAVKKDKADVTETALSGGVVHIETGAYTIQMDLTFLCAAVRYTFLYDGEQDANNETAWMYNYFDVDKIDLTNVNDSYTIFATESALSSAKSTAVDIKSNGKNYTFTGGTEPIYQDPSILSKENGVGTVANSWADTDKKRAHQGVVYLPMNTSSDNQTTLTLSYKTEKNGTAKTSVIKLPALKSDNVLHRGAYYDVVGTLTTSGMEFYVTVKPWVDGGREVFPI